MGATQEDPIRPPKSLASWRPNDQQAAALKAFMDKFPYADSADEVPVASMYKERFDADEKAAYQRLTLSQTPLLDSLEEPTVTPGTGDQTVNIDISPETLARAADSARAMPDNRNREKILGRLKEKSFRGMVNSSLDAVSGGVLSLDAIDAHIRAEMEGLPSPLAETLKSKKVLSLLDPAGNVMSALTREQLRRDGLLPEDLQNELADDVGLAASILTPGAVAGKSKKLAKLGTEIYMTSLFSNPASHAANIGSNLLTSTWSIPERFLAAGYEALAWGATLGKHERQVFFGEPGAMVFGAMTALRDAIVEAGYTLRTGESRLPNVLQDMAFHHQLAEAKRVLGEKPLYRYGPEGIREVQRTAEETTVGQGMSYWSMIWRSPMRALGAEDVAFKIINRNMEIYAQAYREAARTGDMSFSNLRHMVANPSDEVASRADQFATALTFQRSINELGPVFQQVGSIGTQIQDFTLANIPLGRLIAPVMRTPINIAHFTVERAPGLNLLSSTFRADIAAGGALRAQAVGKLAGGASMAGVVYMLAGSGMITGGGPADVEMRKQKHELTGWQPYSIRIGDTYYSYDRLAPLGAVLGLIADASEIGGHLDDYKAQTLGTAVALAVANNLTSKTFLEGAANLFAATAGDSKAMGRLAGSLISITTPGVLRGATKVTDPYRREVNPGAVPEGGGKGSIAQEVQYLINAYKANIPGLSTDRPPQLNLWGEPIEIPAGWHPDWISPVFRAFMPISASRMDEDVPGKEITRLTQKGLLSIGRAARSILGADPDSQPPGIPPNPLDLGITLTDTEYHDYVKLAGNELKNPNTGLGMHDAMTKLVTEDPRYTGEKVTDAARATLITNMVSAYRQAAVAALLKQHPGLLETYKAHLEAMKQSLRGGQQ